MMMTTGKQDPIARRRKGAAKRRLSASGRMLVSYLAFVAASLLIFDALILMSLLP